MPVEAKPLFRPDALRPHLKAFQLPRPLETYQAILSKWADMLSSGKANRFKEQEILGDFLNDVFCGVLDYARPADDPDRHTISREKHVQVDGKFADAVLGDFREGKEQFVVALEGKGPRDPLDRPFAGRHMSAVDQGYRYAINLPCDWIIVTSIRQTRLYYKGCDQQTYERFDTERLAEDEALLKKFVFLLGAARVVPLAGRCHLYDLLAASEKVGKQLTKDFYVSYANMRQEAFESLCEVNTSESRHAILTATQKVLDRVLFTAFCEDRGLLPDAVLRRAFEHKDPFNPRPVWENFRGLFRSINAGNEALQIPAYNGGLFADDPVIDRLNVSDDVCAYFRDLGEYQYRSSHEVTVDETADARVIDVDILGHIFEQSITDLEQLRNELDGLVAPLGKEKHKTRRKKEGAFYTPSFITRYIVEQSLGVVLTDRFEKLRTIHAGEASGTAAKALADPRVYDRESLNKPQRDALIRFWEAWQETLVSIRLCDPACGSGAFLIEAFDQMHTALQQSNDRLVELRGHQTLFDMDRQILQNNLYGVDLNEEAIEICRLSLWIKTASRGKMLTSLDHNIRVGNSVVDDCQVHPKAFDWRAAFPEVFANGGFDVVVANPPYIRQEWLRPYKEFWAKRFPCVYAGTADIYVYFYALGLELLNPGARLAFISSNAFARAAYAERLREHLRPSLEQFIDLGDTQVFSDAKDVYPAIVVLSKPNGPKTRDARRVRVRTVRLRRKDDPSRIGELVDSEGWDIPNSRLSAEGWQFDEPVVTALRDKLHGNSKALREFIDGKIYLGLKTGLNDAFVIDTPTRDRLVGAHAGSADVIKPFVGGQDLRRWYSEDSGRWLILMPNGTTAERCGHAGEEQAAIWLQVTYPAIADYLAPFEARARNRGDKGQFWWELRPCDYCDAFERPKIVYPDIAKSNRFHLDTTGLYCSNTTYFLPVGDWYLLGILNSKAIWFALGGISIPFGERAGEYRYRLFSQYIDRLPVPIPSEPDRQGLATVAEQCNTTGQDLYAAQENFRRRLRSTFGQTADGSPLGDLNQKAEAWWELSLPRLGPP